jgi:hypothetical protein
VPRLIPTCGFDPRRMEKFVESVGIMRLSKGWVSTVAGELDAGDVSSRDRWTPARRGWSAPTPSCSSFAGGQSRRERGGWSPPGLMPPCTQTGPRKRPGPA